MKYLFLLIFCSSLYVDLGKKSKVYEDAEGYLVIRYSQKYDGDDEWPRLYLLPDLEQLNKYLSLEKNDTFVWHLEMKCFPQNSLNYVELFPINALNYHPFGINFLEQFPEDSLSRLLYGKYSSLDDTIHKNLITTNFNNKKIIFVYKTKLSLISGKTIKEKSGSCDFIIERERLTNYNCPNYYYKGSIKELTYLYKVLYD